MTEPSAVVVRSVAQLKEPLMVVILCFSQNETNIQSVLSTVTVKFSHNHPY